MEEEKISAPNIFDFAPSELTQDAFICWLSKWSKQEFREKNKALHETGSNFVESMLEKHEVKLNGNSKFLEIQRQAQGVIDILIELDNHVILIEDKVYTTEHSDQLEIYKKQITAKYLNKKILPIYFQTGIQSKYDKVHAAGYEIFSRKDFLKILGNGQKLGIKNDVYLSFYNYLKKMDERFRSFKNKKIENWEWEGWQGFYTLLQQQFDGNWDYVPNRSGGFMGFWWNFSPVYGCVINMHLEEEKLCYKIEVTEKTQNYSKLRNYWHGKIIQASKDSELSIIKPKRFGYGKTMTVAILESDYRVSESNGLLNEENTIKKLKKAEDILNKAVNSAKDI